jgi:hypothetical protein
MTEQQTETPPAATAEPAATTITERLDRVEQMLKGLVAKLHGGAQATTEARLDAPNSVADEVKAELERARQEEAARADGDRHRQRIDDLEAQVKALTEKPPSEPPRRSTRIMFGGDK